MKAVIILCAVALIMANAQELNQYEANGVSVVDGQVDPVNVVDGQNNAGYPVINNPDSYFYQPQRPYYPSGNNGGYPVISPNADQFFYQPPRPNYQGGNHGGQGVQNPDQFYYGGGVQPNNPNIDISPAYVQNPSNYPAHLYPGGNPLARDAGK